MSSVSGAPPGVDDAVLRNRLGRLWPYALIAGVGAIVLLPGLGSFGLWDPLEPRFAQGAREMLEQRTFATPTFDGEPERARWILGYWAIALGYVVFGVGELGARIGGVLATLVAMCAVGYAVARMRGRRAGLLSACVLGTAPLCYFLARQSLPEVYFFTAIGVSLALFCLALFVDDERRNTHFAIAYVFWALAALARGPWIAGVIFFVPLAIYGSTRIDMERMWDPELRPRTRRLLMTGGAALLGILVAGLMLVIFAASTRLWDLPSGLHVELLQWRQSVGRALTRAHLDVILLVLAVPAGAWVAWRCGRALRGSAGSLVAMVTGPWLLGTLLALVGLALPTSRGRIGLLSAAVLVFALQALSRSVARFVSEPPLREPAHRMFRAVSRQALLFLAIATVLVGPWLVFGMLADVDVAAENVELEEASGSSPSYYYLRPVIYGMFPWSCFLPVALVMLIGWRDRDPFRTYGLEIYMLMAAAAGFAVVGSAVDKLPYFLAPLLVPFSVVIGLTLDALLRDDGGEGSRIGGSRIGWIAAAMLYLPTMLDLGRDEGFEYLLGVFTRERSLPDEFTIGGWVSLLLVAFAALLMLQVLFRSRVLVGGLALVAVLFAHHTASVLVPSVTHEKNLKGLCDAWREVRAPDETIGVYGDLQNSARFYCSRVRRLRGNEVVAFLRPDRVTHVLVEKDELAGLREIYRRRHPGRSLGIVDSSHPDYALVASGR